MLNNLFIAKFVKFACVGLSGTVVDFSITWLVKDKLGLNKYLANSLGFVCAAFSNYILNRIWTFESHNPEVSKEFSSFFIISIIGLAMNNAIIWILNDKMKINFYVSKVLAIGIVMIWNFLANYLITFASK